jgi:hypothetical protein
MIFVIYIDAYFVMTIFHPFFKANPYEVKSIPPFPFSATSSSPNIIPAVSFAYVVLRATSEKYVYASLISSTSTVGDLRLCASK